MNESNKVWKTYYTLILAVVFAVIVNFIVPALVYAFSVDTGTVSESAGEITDIEDCPIDANIFPDDAIGAILWIGEQVSLWGFSMQDKCAIVFLDGISTTTINMRYVSGSGGQNYLDNIRTQAVVSRSDEIETAFVNAGNDNGAGVLVYESGKWIIPTNTNFEDLARPWAVDEAGDFNDKVQIYADLDLYSYVHEPVYEGNLSAYGGTTTLLEEGVGYSQFQLISGYTTTRIVDFFIDDYATTSSPASIWVDVYVDSDDMPAEVFFNLISIDDPFQNLDDSYPWENGITIDVAATGTSRVYATTSAVLSDGTYELRATLKEDAFWFPTVFERDRVIFAIGDEISIIGELARDFEILVGTSSASSTIYQTWTSCVTDLSQCIYRLFVPSQQQVLVLFTQAEETIFDKFPWGYITRFVTIMTSASTSPNNLDLTLTIPPGLPMAGEAITVPITDTFSSTSLINTSLSTSTGDTFDDIVRPYYLALLYTLVGISLFFIVYRYLR